MSFILKEYVKGILLRGVSSDITDNLEGSIFHNSNTKRLKTYIDSAIREIITSSQVQTLTNKTIDYNQNTILNLPSGGGGGGGGTPPSVEDRATIYLDNISTTSIPDGSNLLSTSSNYFTIGTENKSSNTGEVRLATGEITSGGTGNTGVVSVYSGTNNTSGSSGIVFVASGQAKGSGSSGSVFLKSQKSLSGISGDVYVSTGAIDTTQEGYNNSSNSNTTGFIQINTGRIRNTSSTLPSGAVSLSSGSSTSTGGSGSVVISSGNVGDGAIPGAGISGDLLLSTGNADGGIRSSGSIYIATGDLVNGSTGTKGDLIINTRRIYAENGVALIPSTLNNIISTNIIDLLNSSGTVYHKNITATTNFQFTNGIAGKRFTVVVKNATGSNLTANFPTVKQKSGTIINTITANSSSIFEFLNSDGEYYCISCINNMV